MIGYHATWAKNCCIRVFHASKHIPSQVTLESLPLSG